MERFENSLELESLPDTQEATQERLSLEPIAPEEDVARPKPWGRLVSLNPDVQHYLLVEDETTLGRAKMCSLTLADSHVSARHCKIVRERGGEGDGHGTLAFIHDTSSNGTFLNKEKITKGEQRMLRDKDIISLVHPTPDKLAFQYEDFTAANNTPAWKKGIASRYDIIKELGKGSFSVVMLGISKKTRQKVALKIIDKKKYWNMSKTSEQLAREVSILQKLKHQHIIQVIDCVENEEWLYLVLELASGGDLFDNLKEREKFTEKDARRIFHQILDALKYLHASGTAHRDLKPENMLVPAGDRTRVKLADFGFARLAAATTRLTTPCGTPGYAAPEIGAAQAYTRGVDMWSVGVVLYTMLAGFPPFYSDDDALLMEQVAEGRVYFPNPYWRDVSPAAKHLVRALLERNAELRLSAAQMLAHPWFRGEEMAEERRVEEEERAGRGLDEGGAAGAGPLQAQQVRRALNRTIDAHRDGCLLRSSTESSIVSRRRKGRAAAAAGPAARRSSAGAVASHAAN
mmetsp:Transcript_20477/g.78507  ORF Transcript_20477/g.78507 Transcript_20477/m.78507 type:complete len:517 (+) Transcript_20477:182-1732(+)